MGKLEELRQIVADMFSQATEKGDIDRLSKINNSLDDVEKEQAELENKNAELIKSYKDLVKHTSFKDNAKPSEPAGASAVSFEDALAQFMSEKE